MLQAHTGFAIGELGFRYETTLCESFVNSLHLVNVLAQRYKCAPRACRHRLAHMLHQVGRDAAGATTHPATACHPFRLKQLPCLTPASAPTVTWVSYPTLLLSLRVTLAYVWTLRLTAHECCLARCSRIEADKYVVVPGSVQFNDIVKLERRRRISVKRAAVASGGNLSGSKQLFERSTLLFFKAGHTQLLTRLLLKVSDYPSARSGRHRRQPMCRTRPVSPPQRYARRVQGKCTPLRFDWKESAVNVGKLMRYEVVKELQDVGPDVHVECTGDPAELKEVKLKDEVSGLSGLFSVLRLRRGRWHAQSKPVCSVLVSRAPRVYVPCSRPNVCYSGETSGRKKAPEALKQSAALAPDSALTPPGRARRGADDAREADGAVPEQQVLPHAARRLADQPPPARGGHVRMRARVLGPPVPFHAARQPGALQFVLAAGCVLSCLSQSLCAKLPPACAGFPGCMPVFMARPSTLCLHRLNGPLAAYNGDASCLTHLT